MSMPDLIAGYHRFRDGPWPQLREVFLQLAQGQAPKTLILACSDSRVDPQRVFDAAPGELFVVRNVAALCPPYQPDGHYHGTSAALEFGVNALEVSQIVVMGHGRCGGCAALLGGAPHSCPEFVAPWIEIAAPARARAQERAIAGADAQRACEEETVRETLANLRSFPFVAKATNAGRLTLHGMWFDVGLGELWQLDPGGTFAMIAARGP